MGQQSGGKSHKDEREPGGEGRSMSSASSDEEVQAVVGEGMMFQEDNFLTSANLCRWVIDFNEIALGKQVRNPPPPQLPAPMQHALT